VYTQGNCHGLQAPVPDWPAFTGVKSNRAVVIPQKTVQHATIQSIGVLVKPLQTEDVMVKADIMLKNGQHGLFSGHRKLSASGGQVLLTLPKPLSNPLKLTLRVYPQTAVLGALPDQSTAVLWYGHNPINK